MSYEFYLANPDDKKAKDEADDAPFNRGPIDASAEARKRALADALIELNPELEVFRFNHDALAKSLGMTVGEVKHRYRHLELNGPEDGNGIQITLYHTHATIAVPYWHSGTEAVAVIEEIWEYMRLLHSAAGMQPFDPQLGRALNLEEDFPTVLQRFSHGVSSLDSEIE